MWGIARSAHGDIGECAGLWGNKDKRTLGQIVGADCGAEHRLCTNHFVFHLHKRKSNQLLLRGCVCVCAQLRRAIFGALEEAEALRNEVCEGSGDAMVAVVRMHGKLGLKRAPGTAAPGNGYVSCGLSQSVPCCSHGVDACVGLRSWWA